MRKEKCEQARFADAERSPNGVERGPEQGPEQGTAQGTTQGTEHARSMPFPRRHPQLASHLGDISLWDLRRATSLSSSPSEKTNFAPFFTL